MGAVDPVGDALTQVEQTLKTHADAVSAMRKAYDATLPPPDPGVITVTAGQNLRSILETAPPGATVRVEPNTTFEGPFILSKPVTLTSTVDLGNAMATPDPPVWLTCTKGVDTITISGPDIRIMGGIGVKNSGNRYQLIAIIRSAERTTIDQVTCLGDPQQGQRRGIRPEGKGYQITRTLVDHIGLVGIETQAIGASSGSDGLIDRCVLSGAAEAVMFGGSDIPTSDLTPMRVKITNSVLTKRPEWYAMGWQIKNAFEVKMGDTITLSDSILEYAGISEGQGGYAILGTVRNQSGGSPFAYIKQILVDRCLIRHVGGCASFLGHDTNNPSGGLDGFIIRNCKFTDVDPNGITKGTGRCFVFDKAPKNVTLDALTIEGQNLTHLGFFPSAGQATPAEPVALTMTNWKYPTTKYGWFINNGPHDIPPASKNLQAYMPDMVYKITATDPGATGYPQPQ